MTNGITVLTRNIDINKTSGSLYPKIFNNQKEENPNRKIVEIRTIAFPS
tara:strand:+ start:211 stop:357 length:147 start_codon:yes stop_codon:yes gene_type:complete